MLKVYKTSLVLKVQKFDEDGEPKETRVTLANVRNDLTAAEFNQLIDAFQSLISHEITSAEVLQYNVIV